MCSLHSVHCLHSHDSPLLVSSEISTASIFPIHRIRHASASISFSPCLLSILSRFRVLSFRSLLLLVMASAFPTPPLSFVPEFNIIKLDFESTSVCISFQRDGNKSVVIGEKFGISGNEITFLSVAIRANFERRFDTMTR